jgi:hypothetical protein
MLPSPFILSFYLRHTDDQLVKVEITSSHSRFSRMFVPFYGKVWKNGRKGEWKGNDRMSLHSRNAYRQGVSTVDERKKETTGFYRWAIQD